MTNVLILSAASSAMNYVFSLRRRKDLRLFVTDASPYAGGLYEDGVTPILLPPARSREAYRVELERVLKKYAIDLLIPTSDYDIEAVMQLQGEGWAPAGVKMFRPSQAAYRILADKQELTRAMGALGFAVPRVFSSVDEVLYPAVVKPTRESGGKGVAVVNDRAELEAQLERIAKRFGGHSLIQEFIPGEIGSTHIALLLYGADGTLHGQISTHSHLTEMTWGCGGHAGTYAGANALRAQAIKMIEAAGGWAGPVNFEFRRHERDGKFYLMEANCRLNGYSHHSTMNGLNFPAAVVDLLITGKTQPLSEDDVKNPRNFIIGYREKPIDRFVT